MLVHRIPYPPDKGDKIRSFNQLKFLCEQGWLVHLCALADDPVDLQYVKELNNYCLTVTVLRINPALQKIVSIIAPLTGKPMSAGYFYHQRIQKRVDEVLRCRPVSAVLCFCSPMAEYLRRSPYTVAAVEETGVRYVMDMVDVDSEKWGQYAQRSRPPMKWVYQLEGWLLRRYEERIVDIFHATALVSDAEAEILRNRVRCNRAIYTVSNGVDLNFFHPIAPQKPHGERRIIFCGAMNYFPNIDAVTWFAKEVLPLVRRALGVVEFVVVGGGGGRELDGLKKLPGVSMTGRVPDVRPFIWNADLSVCPMRIARGIQNKVLESMALGVPVVVTPQAFEGLEVVAGRDLILAPFDPDAFAAAVINILNDSQQWRTVSASARQTVETKYSWKGRLQVLKELLSAASEGPFNRGVNEMQVSAGQPAFDFSIVIPARNEEVNIARCLDSLQELRYERSRFEVVVIDNGSTDRTVEVARARGATVFQKPGVTISGLRNFGARHSFGDIIVFLDADCAVIPDWLEAASRYLNCRDVVAYGSPVIVPKGGTWVQKAWFNVRGKPGLVIDVNWLESANLFVRREAFDAVGGFDETLVTCEDYDLTQRLRRKGRLISDHRVMAIHYREPATVTDFVKKEMWRGKNNYTGMARRAIHVTEIPSLVLPLLALLFALGLFAFFIMAALGAARSCLYLPAIFILWQGAIVSVSFMKNRSKDPLTLLQLVLLFNAYFLARGVVLLKRSW